MWVTPNIPGSILLTLLQSAALSDDDKYDRSEAFCEGLGVRERVGLGSALTRAGGRTGR
jgi:hypothetical protein